MFLQERNKMEKIQVTKVTLADAQEILQYVIEFRKGLFPMLDPGKVPGDLANFNEVYINNPKGVFLQARDEQGNLIGVIGMMEYDHRFPYLDYSQYTTVEVARLFVEPAYRRKKIAQLLVDELKKVAIDKGINMLYLHTHPFLTGAFEFWQKQGFRLIKDAEEGGFSTLHMEHPL